jgi:hypothetical protein
MYEVQTVECGGIPRAEYACEPELLDDPEPEFALTCGQCDYYIADKADLAKGNCALTKKTKRSCSLACSQILVTSPF